MFFKDILREIMDRQRLSQTKLANASDVPRETIRGWFKRNSSPREWEQVVDIGHALSCGASDIERLLYAAGHPQVNVLLPICRKSLSQAQTAQDEFAEYAYQMRLARVEAWQAEEIDAVAQKDRSAVADPIIQDKNEVGADVLEQVPGESPYMGLNVFDETDAELFFGREKLSAEFAHRLCHQSFLAIIGASGSGKSSLVRAGLIPLLRSGKIESEGESLPADCQNWAIEITTPKSNPLAELASCLTRDKPYSEQAELESAMRNRSDGLDSYTRRYLRQRSAERLLLIIDQFEELFTHQIDNQNIDNQNSVEDIQFRKAGPEEIRKTSEDRLSDQQAFVENLLAAQNSDCTIVVLTVRADFYSRCLDFPSLRALLPAKQVNIGPLEQEGLRRAIEQPALLNDWEFEDLLVDDILEDMEQERGTLPLLSHALLETWERRQGKTLTRKGYRDAGRIQGAIAHTAEQFYQSLNEDEQALVRSIFIRMTSLGEGTEDTRRRVNLDELRKLRPNEQQVNKVVAQLAGERLIITDRDDASNREQANIVHEALIKNWQRLERWLRDDRDGLRIHRRLMDTVAAWQATNCEDASLLYVGTQLELAETWKIDHLRELNELEQSFLIASIAERDRQDAEKKRIEHERDEAKGRALLGAQKARKRALIAVAATLGALFLLIGTSAYFYNEYRQSNLTVRAQELIAESRILKAQLKGTEAIERLREAKLLDDDFFLNFELEEEQIRREVANGLTAQGETLLRIAQDKNDSKLRATSYFSATNLFKEALALEPPVDALVYVKIPAGDFQMSTSTSAQTTYVDEFWIMRTEVTKEQYKRCVNMSYCDTPDDTHYEDKRFQRDPIVGVTQQEASTYAKWVGGRLPLKAEWEYACRGTDARIYPWGNEDPTIDLANYRQNQGNSTAPVGSYPQGISPYGLYDMVGNAQEWVIDNVESDKITYSLRGGAFSFPNDFVKCEQRSPADSSHSLTEDGFRVVVEVFSSGK